MSRTNIASRIQWLYPVEREVYRTRLARTHGDCKRCSSRVYPGKHGMREGVEIKTRDRYTERKHTATDLIHRGCIPTADFKQIGVAPRGRRSNLAEAA